MQIQLEEYKILAKPLEEYAWLVETVRQKQREGKDMDTAVDEAIDEMADDSEIKPFLVANRAEVKSMFLTVYDEEKHMRQEREEGRDEKATEVASDMLKEGDSIAKVTRISKLSEDTVRNLAKTLGIATT